MAFRRRVSETGKLLPITEYDAYPYQIQDIVQDTADYASDQPAKVSKKATKKVAHKVLAYGARAKPTPGTHKPGIDWHLCLPRSYAEVLSLPASNLYRSCFIVVTAAEIKSLRDS